MQLNSLNTFWNMLYNSSEMLTQAVLIFTDIQRLRKTNLIRIRVQKNGSISKSYRYYYISENLNLYLYLFWLLY